MRAKGLAKAEVLARLRQTNSKDVKYRDGKILCSMCTSPHPMAKRAYEMFLESNLGDPGLFQGSVQLENEAVNSLIKLLHGPKGASGFIVSGGTEANLLALFAARKASTLVEPEVVAPESAHFSFEKICDILKIKLVKARLDNTFRVDPAEVESHINAHTLAIIGNAGSAELGTVDPISVLSKIALNHGIPLHVDAAFGGLVLPFFEKLGYTAEAFDFSLNGVHSITVDPHKMGVVPIPAGGILFRNSNSLQGIQTSTPYLTEPRQFTFVGTRSGASVAATWAVFESLGREGFEKNVKRCMYLTMFLNKELRELGFEIVVKPTINIVAFRGDNSKQLVTRLRERGWYVSYVPRLDCVRIVVMPHSTKRHICDFLKIIQEVGNPPIA